MWWEDLLFQSCDMHMGAFVLCVGVPSSPLSIAHLHIATLFLSYWLKQGTTDSDSSGKRFVFLPVLPCFSSETGFKTCRLLFRPVFVVFRFIFVNYRSVLLGWFWGDLSLLHVLLVLWHSVFTVVHTFSNHNSVLLKLTQDNNWWELSCLLLWLIYLIILQGSLIHISQ